MQAGKINDVALGAAHELRVGINGLEMSEISGLLRRLPHDLHPALFDLCFWKQVERKLGYPPTPEGRGHIVFFRMTTWHRRLRDYLNAPADKRTDSTPDMIRFCEAMAHSKPTH